MCNACGFYCCGSDEFSRCDCDYCDEPDCWSDDFDEDDFDAFDDLDCACSRPSSFQCVQIIEAAP